MSSTTTTNDRTGAVGSFRLPAGKKWHPKSGCPGVSQIDSEVNTALDIQTARCKSLRWVQWRRVTPDVPITRSRCTMPGARRTSAEGEYRAVGALLQRGIRALGSFGNAFFGILQNGLRLRLRIVTGLFLTRSAISTRRHSLIVGHITSFLGDLIH